MEKNTSEINEWILHTPGKLKITKLICVSKWECVLGPSRNL
jgi:hypothetical protein